MDTTTDPRATDFQSDNEADEPVSSLETSEPPPEVPEAFSVCDESSANWLVRRIVEARAYAERVTTWAEREKRRARREEEFFMHAYGRQLEDWAAGRIALLGGRRKSLNLPAGSVGFRTAGPRLVVDDEPAVMNWARRNCPDAVVTIERLSKSALNQRFKTSGEIPEQGAHLEDAHQTFYVK